MHEVLILWFLSVVLVLMLSPTYDYLNVGEDNKKWPYDEYCDPPGSIYKCKRVYHEGVLNKFFSYCLTKIVGMLINKPNTKYLMSLFWSLMLILTTKLKTKRFGFWLLVIGWCNERNWLEFYLTPDMPLNHTSCTYSKWNMGEICGLKFHLWYVHTSQKVLLKSLHSQKRSFLLLNLQFWT